MPLTDTFQEDGTVVRNFEDIGYDATDFEWLGQYRIDGDLLCTDFLLVVVGGEGRPELPPTEKGFGESSPASRRSRRAASCRRAKFTQT